MKASERGFTLIEMLIAITVTALASGAASVAIFQILKNIERNSDHMTVVRHVENAGDWISRDAQMALSANGTASLTLPDFLIINWTEWDASGDPVYHSARYFFEDLTGGTSGVGSLKRIHQSSAGANEQMLVAQNIYYDSTDVTNTSNASYQSPVLTVKLTARLEQSTESKEYKIKRRPTL